MGFLLFTQFILRIFTIPLLLTSIFLIYTVLKGYNYFRKLGKVVESLSEGVTAEKIDEFMNHLDAKYIPFYVGGMMKAGYQLVGMDESVDCELKKRLKIKILSRVSTSKTKSELKFV